MYLSELTEVELTLSLPCIFGCLSSFKDAVTVTGEKTVR